MYNHDFATKFGRIFMLEPTGGYAYEPLRNNNTFVFPEGTTQETINDLIEKSLLEKHDYVFDLVKSNKLETDPSLVY